MYMLGCPLRSFICTLQCPDTVRLTVLSFMLFNWLAHLVQHRTWLEQLPAGAAH